MERKAWWELGWFDIICYPTALVVMWTIWGWPEGWLDWVMVPVGVLLGMGLWHGTSAAVRRLR